MKVGIVALLMLDWVFNEKVKQIMNDNMKILWTIKTRFLKQIEVLKETNFKIVSLFILDRFEK